MKKRLTIISFLLLAMCSFVNAQIFFYEDFNDGNLDGWTNHDLDGDGLEWTTYDLSMVAPQFGTGTMVSFSNMNGQNISPDNLITSPAIDLTNAPSSGVVFTFDGLGDPTEHDKYAIYITTSNNPQEIIASTPVRDTLTSYEFSGEIDMSSYIGQTVYISFRHYETVGKYYVMIDNVEVKVPYSDDLSLDEVYIENRFINPDEKFMVEVKIKNRGNATVDSCKLSWNDGGQDQILNFTTPIPAGEERLINFPDSLSYSDTSQHIINVSILEHNGTPDTITFNNTKSVSLATMSQSVAGKMLIEQSTGTWCGYCPRGILAMATLDSLYSEQAVGIAVHSNDPMSLTEYYTASAFVSAPAIHSDRLTKNVNFTEDIMIAILGSATPRVATMNAVAELNGLELTVNLNSTFYSNFNNADFRYAVILSEDNVTGTGAEYSQTNYYSNNPQGAVMGGYENLPDPVPAEQMVYDHVGRALIGGYDGQAGSVPSTLTDGQSISYSFNYTFAEDAKISNFKAIGILIDNTTGQVINTDYVRLNTITSVNQVNVADKGFDISPNPATDVLHLEVEESGNYTMSIHSLDGKLISQKQVNVSANGATITHNVSELSAGVYLISLSTDKQSFNKRLVINK